MAFRPHKFGRYIIVDPIAVGGMAEIYRARLAASKEGPDRVIVIKKVIANLSQNSEFIQMFEEEIKITVGLTNPNIIQIYDYGKVDEQYFMAMEYVEGKNLRQFVKRLADMKSMFSIDMSCYIISQVCHALAYAHAFKDRMSGKSLGIVHRDISPQNVMISYDGAVKLFDFGIAKAKSASESTRAGVIKGKPSYLSPEQINGEELDGRCDIFALGIVLWELLTAKRLFVAETDMGVLRLIQSAKIEPPSTFNPAVPQSLDAIVLKSLTRDKNKRYQSSEEFQRDLHKFLYSFNPSFNPADLSYYAQELFKNEIREDRERLQKYLSIEPIDDSKPGDGTGSGVGKGKHSTKLAEGLISTTDYNREVMDQVVQSKTGSVQRPKGLELMSSAAMTQPKSVAVGAAGGAPSGKGAPSPDGGSGLIVKNPSGQLSSVKKAAASDNMVIPPWTKTGNNSAGSLRNSSHTRTQTQVNQSLYASNSSGGKSFLMMVLILVVGGVFVSRQSTILCKTPLASLATRCGDSGGVVPKVADSDPGDAKKPPVVPAATNSESGTTRGISSTPEAVIVLKTTLEGYFVYVNGRQATVINSQFNVPLKETIKIEVARHGFQTQRFTVPPIEKAGTYGFDVPAVPLVMGSVFFNTLPGSSLVFYLGGEKIFEGSTPLKTDLPVGTYKVEIENSVLGIRTEREFVVEKDRMNRAEITLDMKK